MNTLKSFVFVCFVSVGIFGNAPPRAHALTDFSEISERAEKSIGIVEALFFDEKGNRRMIYRGTGFVISQNGLVLTNEHVLIDEEDEEARLADAFQITFFKNRSDRKAVTYPLLLRGVDKVEDIALLQIRSDEEMSFEALSLGNSKALTIGEVVGVYGYGEESGVVEKSLSFSEGYLSSRDFTLAKTPFTRYLSFHFLIYPGGSGGPVLNTRGEVVAVVAQTKQSDFDNQSLVGMVAAVPIDDVLIEQLEKGSLNVGMLDISWGSVPFAEMRYWPDEFRKKYPFAIRVHDSRKTPLAMNDIVVAFREIPLFSSEQLLYLVRSHQDRPVELTVFRGTEKITVEVFIGHSVPE